MKKRILKIGALALAILLILGVLWFANGLVGNPVSYLLAKNTAEKHLEANYADQNFVLERVSFSFKDGQYHAYVTSPSSLDSDFTMLINLWGKLRYDTYEDRVLNRGNTADRLRDDYRAMVDAILDNPTFPYFVDIGFGELVFVEKTYADDPTVPDYAILANDLTLDGVYNVNEMGATAGKLTLYATDDTVTHQRLAEILLTVRDRFDRAGVRFYAVDLVLEYPKSEDGTFRDGRVEVMEFLYSDIYEEGLVERVTASDEAAKDYYVKQDQEKIEESK